MVAFETTVAYSGTAGVHAAREVKPDIVVCDIGLPGMDGFEVAAALKSHAELKNAKLIAVTGYGSDDVRDKALECGFDTHLMKPVEPEDLLAQIQFVSNPSSRNA